MTEFLFNQSNTIFPKSIEKEYSINDLMQELEDFEKIVQANKINEECVLKPDFFYFKNHVWFDSALEKSTKTVENIQNLYPFDETRNNYDDWYYSSSFFDRYIFETDYNKSASFGYPKAVGTYCFNGTDPTQDTYKIQYSDSGSIYYNILGKITSSLTVELNLQIPQQYDYNHFLTLYPAWQIDNYKISILHNLSCSKDNNNYYGYDFHIKHVSDSNEPHLVFEILSGSSVAFVSSSISSWLAESGSWRHVAGQLDTENNLINLYLTGTLINSSSGQNIIEFNTKTAPITLGSLTSSFYSIQRFSASFYTGSIDELRIWHTKRSSDEIDYKKNTEIYAQDNLILYSKFNETTGSFAIDYSGHGIHGICSNYKDICRNINYNSNFATHMLYEKLEPILHTNNSLVNIFTSSLYFSASEYDNENQCLITEIFNPYLIEKDIEENNGKVLLPFLYSCARVLDEFKLYIEQFSNFLNVNYDDVDTIPDKIYPYLLQFLGWQNNEWNGDKSALSFLFGEKSTTNLQDKKISLNKLKNVFWKRLSNNLLYLFKSKGTARSIKELLRIYGVDPEWIKIKESGYKINSPLSDYFVLKNKTRKALIFGSGSQYTSSSIVFNISGDSSGPPEDFSFESHIKFPYYSSYESSSIWNGSLLTSSLFTFYDNPASGHHDSGSFYAIRANLTSSYGKLCFSCSNQNQLVNFSSSDIPLFNNKWWNIALTFDSDQSKNLFSIRTGLLSDENINDISYNLIFTQSAQSPGFPIPKTWILGFNNDTNHFTGSECYLHECRLWNKILSNSEWISHIKDFENIGIEDYKSNYNKLYAYWKLEDNFSTTAGGTISLVDDYTQQARTGIGYNFPESKTSGSLMVSKNMFYNQLQIDFNYNNVNDDFKVRTQPNGELPNFQNSYKDLPMVFIEFSLADVLSDYILKRFVSGNKFHNYIGNPVKKYLTNYQELDNVKEIYFKNLTSSVDFETYKGMFNWFDTNFTNLIYQLVPGKSIYKGNEFVVESHILERNKYTYPYLDQRQTKEKRENIHMSSIRGNNSNILNNRFGSPAIRGSIIGNKIREINSATSERIRDRQ